jgi:nitrate/nitrite transporter NarK
VGALARLLVSALQNEFGLRIVGSSLALWIPIAVLTALPPVIVGLWEARPRSSTPG